MVIYKNLETSTMHILSHFVVLPPILTSITGSVPFTWANREKYFVTFWSHSWISKQLRRPLPGKIGNYAPIHCLAFYHVCVKTAYYQVDFDSHILFIIHLGRRISFPYDSPVVFPFLIKEIPSLLTATYATINATLMIINPILKYSGLVCCLSHHRLLGSMVNKE